jgi:hypothetical protein
VLPIAYTGEEALALFFFGKITERQHVFDNTRGKNKGGAVSTRLMTSTAFFNLPHPSSSTRPWGLFGH